VGTVQQDVDNCRTMRYHGSSGRMEVSMATCEAMIGQNSVPPDERECGKPARYAVLETFSLVDGDFTNDDVWVRYCVECYGRCVGLPVPTMTGHTRTVELEIVGYCNGQQAHGLG